MMKEFLKKLETFFENVKKYIWIIDMILLRKFKILILMMSNKKVLICLDIPFYEGIIKKRRGRKY